MRLLDLYCGAGGAARGYELAGFTDITGVDKKYQHHYPYTFVYGDAIEYLVANWRNFDVIHASPPCQAYSSMSACRPGLAGQYPDVVGETRMYLELTGLPYIIENVPGAPLFDPVMLCGQMFDLDLYRHRLFETNWSLPQPEHPQHTKPASRAGHWTPGTVMSISGHVAPISVAREAMGINWMVVGELAEAIPPAYTEWIGRQL